MKLENSVVFISGANRGIGLVFAQEALARGARKVYAAARDPSGVSLPGVVQIELDVTNAEQVAAAAQACADVTLLINNAGIANFGGFLKEGSVDSARAQLEVNFFGPLRLSLAFAPILAANGGGAILNVLSVATWISSPLLGVYAASKSAAWGLTNGLRYKLGAQQTQVLGLHMGFVDTGMTREIEFLKSQPIDIVRRAFDGLEAGAEEVLADEITQQVKQGLSTDPGVYLGNIVRE